MVIRKLAVVESIDESEWYGDIAKHYLSQITAFMQNHNFYLRFLGA